MPTKPYADLAQLMSELMTPLVMKHTGTFFIATEDNASCRFALQEGKFTHCCYKRLHGFDAIQAIKEGFRGRGAFSENKRSLFKDADQVDHQTVVEQLGIRIPAVESGAAFPAEAITSRPKQSKIIYRGQEVFIDAPQQHDSSAKKRTLVYRGQVIED
jgi:hypothetical protein